MRVTQNDKVDRLSRLKREIEYLEMWGKDVGERENTEREVEITVLGKKGKQKITGREERKKRKS